jgi:hypothetical protein
LDHRLKQYIEVLETSGCPRATDLPHQEAEIVSGYVGDQTLEDVLVSAQVDTAHPPGVIIMCEPSFDSFGPETSKQCTSVSFDPASVRIYGIAGIVFPLPLTATPVGFGDVAAYAALLQAHQCLVAVVAVKPPVVWTPA